jgi:hypothetical protein
MMHNHWMWGMGWGQLIVALILILILVALTKYLQRNQNVSKWTTSCSAKNVGTVGKV